VPALLPATADLHLVDAPSRQNVGVTGFEVTHDDPRATARAAAIRSASERDPALRERARRQTIAERLHEGFRLAAFTSRLRGKAR